MPLPGTKETPTVSNDDYEDANAARLTLILQNALMNAIDAVEGEYNVTALEQIAVNVMNGENTISAYAEGGIKELIETLVSVMLSSENIEEITQQIGYASALIVDLVVNSEESTTSSNSTDIAGECANVMCLNSAFL